MNDFSCTVNGWDGEYIVKMEHLKSLEYSDSDCEQMQLLCDRLSKLRNSNDLEQAAVSVLKHLGQVKRPYLTPLEEKLLGVLEQEYQAI